MYAHTESHLINNSKKYSELNKTDQWYGSLNIKRNSHFCLRKSFIFCFIILEHVSQLNMKNITHLHFSTL